MESSKVFSLEGKGLKLDTAAEIKPHLEHLISNPDIEEVRFQGNTLGTEACEALASVLSTKKNLKVVNLADIFTSRLLSEIPPALSALLNSLLQLPNVHTVDLSDNAFGLNTQAPLVSFLSAHTPLRHLFLNNNGLGPHAGVLIADALVSLAEKKSKQEGALPLETILCGRNRLENGSMEAWARAFAAHGGVKTVRMVQNGIRQEGIVKLLRDGLKAAQGLRILDLQDNTFTALGARALADVVGKWEDLVELGIGDSLLSARGGIMLAEALREGKNGKLEVLRLQFNEIDAKGVKGLSEAIEQIPRLRRVELNGNKFNEDDEGIENLRVALEQRKSKGVEGFEGKEDNDWGLDDLDELEEESDEEDEEDLDGEENADEDDTGVDIQQKAEKELKITEEAETAQVPQEKDKDVDALADVLGRTSI